MNFIKNQSSFRISYGTVFALHELWKDLGFDRALNRALRSGKRGIDVVALVRAMVFNRLCDPTSKLGCLRWLETLAMPAMPEVVHPSAFAPRHGCADGQRRGCGGCPGPANPPPCRS